MKKTLLVSAVVLGVVGLTTIANADDGYSFGDLNFQTEVGASVGSLFGDSGKSENGISRKSKWDENVFVQSIDTNSGFGARIGYTHFGDLKNSNSLIDTKTMQALNDLSSSKEGSAEETKAFNEILDNGNDAFWNAISKVNDNFDKKGLSEEEKLEAFKKMIKDGSITTKNITSTIDLQLAKQFQVAPKVTITGLAGVAYANYTQDNSSKFSYEGNSTVAVSNEQKKHAFLPEAGVEAGYDITDNLMATVGYNHIFSRDDIKAVDTIGVGLAVKFS